MNDHDNTADAALERHWAPGEGPTILQVLPALGAGGGVERGTVEIAGAIVDAGGTAIVVSEGGPQAHDLTRVKADHVTLPVASKNPLTIYNNIKRLVDVIRAHNVDLVHARSRAPAWSAYFASKRTGVPFVTTFHGVYSIGSWLKRRYNGIMARGARVIAISVFIGGHVRRHYGVPVEKIRVIHRGVDLDKFDPGKVSAERVIKLATDWRLPDGMPIVMLPGRLSRWKGQMTMIDAMAKLGRRDICCLLVGGDQGRAEYRRRLERRIEQHGLEEIIRIVDHCDDMPAAYKLTDLVVSASTVPEAFGRIVIEAQAMGRPVIASDHGGARETVLVGETGWLTEPGDADALALAVDIGLSLDEGARNRMAERAIKHVRENFAKVTMCNKTLDVYREVLAEHAAKRRA